MGIFQKPGNRNPLWKTLLRLVSSSVVVYFTVGSCHLSWLLAQEQYGAPTRPEPRSPFTVFDKSMTTTGQDLRIFVGRDAARKARSAANTSSEEQFNA
jgi:hypothetical protein